MNKELRIKLLQMRADLLLQRGQYNAAIVSKINRQIRQLQRD